MIKKYKQFNEGIRHLLVGPTKEEIWDDLEYKFKMGKVEIVKYLYYSLMRYGDNEFNHFVNNRLNDENRLNIN